jgi:hypothetical protein
LTLQEGKYAGVRIGWLRLPTYILGVADRRGGLSRLRDLRELMSLAFFNKAATPFTAGLFLVSAVSGTALFLHMGMGIFHEMHEWLSMVLLLPFAFHVWRNWTPFMAYMKRGWLVIPLALSIAAALPFAIPAMMGEHGGGNPGMAAARLITAGKLSDVAVLMKRSPDELATALRGSGFEVKSNDLTLEEIAAASGKEPRAILGALVRGATKH